MKVAVSDGYESFYCIFVSGFKKFTKNITSW